jgi:deoxyribodipyrimidine photo-lyase
MELASKDSDYFVSLHHDQAVVTPGEILSRSGKPMKVFTPYHKMWVDVVRQDAGLLDTVPPARKEHF